MLKPNEQNEGTTGLVQLLRDGDALAMSAFESLFRNRLVEFCWGYLGTVDEAEDAVQEVSYKVFEAKLIPDTFRPWLYRIARNQCLNMLRARDRRADRHMLPAASQLDAALTGQLTGLVREESQARLAEAVGKLPLSLREALRLRYVENLSRPEIADVLEVSESVVKSRLFEGLQRLRQDIPPPDKT